MLSKILFLNIDVLKELSAIENNVDPKLLRLSIANCQKLHIEPILGTSLYNIIAFEISGNSVSNANKILLNDYIIPALIKRIESAFIIQNSYQFTNSGIKEKTPENTENLPIDDKLRLQQLYKDMAESFEQRIIDYLCANSILYPAYINGNNTSDAILPNHDSTYFSGIVF